MTLGELIEFLAKRDHAHVPPVGFEHPHSYRGIYSELAFEPARGISIGDMLASAKSALGKTFTGYKGGSFTMGEHSDCYLANYGCSGEAIGVVLLGYMCGEHQSAELAQPQQAQSGELT